MMKTIFITVLIILLILFIGGLIYANIRLYQGIKDERKPIEMKCCGYYKTEAFKKEVDKYWELIGR